MGRDLIDMGGAQQGVARWVWHACMVGGRTYMGVVWAWWVWPEQGGVGGACC